ncbi:MAG: methyltransferase C-terminal domain-containing protein, partial [Gammaproteobacteria bacterium]
VNKRLNSILNDEKNAGITTISFYEGFQQKAEQIKVDFLEFLGNAKRSHKTVAAYGAAAKGNTLLNFAGVGTNLISYVVDNNPEKQGKYLPGSRIPIVKESHLQNNRPDYLVILPWNLKSEISERISSMTEQGMKIVTAIPELSVS